MSSKSQPILHLACKWTVEQLPFNRMNISTVRRAPPLLLYASDHPENALKNGKGFDQY